MDKVLVDAPCSGVGTWRRHPEQKWRLKPDDVRRLTQLQGEILSSAARMVRPGGWLVYSTCSFLREENEDQIENILVAKNPGQKNFQIVPIADVWNTLLKIPYLTGPGSFEASHFFKVGPSYSWNRWFFIPILQKKESVRG